MSETEVLKRELDPNELIKLVTMGLGTERFAVPIEEVKEIIAKYEIVPLPKMPAFIEGIISLRGTIVPIVDMRKRFGMAAREAGADAKVVVVDLEGLSVGIQVDTVFQVLKISRGEIKEPPALVAGLKAEYLEGVAEVDGALTVALNLENIFSSTEKMSLIENIASAEKNHTGEGREVNTPQGEAHQ
ncbi:MAG: chemotaxis protein CheW [Deltaproteobacteria bacterium]|nr:chemotaxis protein CheW [Deltaproteobacteria bacterium]